MARQAVVVLGVLVMIAVIVVVDVVFLRHYFWARLATNVGVVLLFGGLYFRFAKPRE